MPQRYQMAAFVRSSLKLRTVLAPHVALQLMDRRRLRSPNDSQSYRLVGVAPEAFHLQINITCVERVTEGRGWLGRSPVSKHALVPGDAGETVGFFSGICGPLGRSSDRTAVDRLSGFGSHRM